MTAIIDASVLVAALADSGPTGVWSGSGSAAKILIGPELVLVETSHILRRLERTGELSRLEATTACRGLHRLELTLFPFAPFATRVWKLRGSLTGHDAWYVALAEALGGALNTLDRKLARRATGSRCDAMVPPRP